jgi:outer membrane receptor protein involved in Fe transport
LGYGINDQRRLQLEDLFIVNPGELDVMPILPSAGLIWRVFGTEEAPFNLRLNFSKTVARPSIRELTETLIYDYEFRNNVFGNSNLKMAEIFNYDTRAEKYFDNADYIALSVFYKGFRNHIEQIKTLQGFSWQNAESAEVYGIEIDGRKKIVEGLEFRTNLTFVKSMTTVVNQFLSIERGIKTFTPIDTVTRQMFGQAPYVVNTMLTYTSDKYKLNASLGYNVQGPRLVVVSADLTPNVFEMPRHLVDIRVSKQFGKWITVAASVRDLLNSPIRRSYKDPEGYTLDFDRFTYGTNYQLSISYRI